jgi:pyruvate dehydrogenase E2 component (dihydrolipoamide acetyltransferase)
MFEYELPDVGEGVAEGEIVVWHAEPGDHVTEDEVLAEVETDKAVVDLPAPVDGVVAELRADPGDMVPVGDVVVLIDTEADDKDTVDTEADDGSPSAGDTADTTGAKTAPDTGDTTDAIEGATGQVAENGAVEGEVSTASGRVFAPPHVRRVARELGVDIGRVDGSGPGGRLTEADVRAAAESGGGETDTVTDSGGDGVAAGVEPGQTAATQENGNHRSAVTPTGTADGTTTDAGAADRDRTLAAPATRGVARELDVDIDEVPTERHRDDEAFVEPEDVRAYAEAQQAAQTADADTASAPVETGSTQTESAAEPVTATAETETTATAETETTAADTRTEPYRGIRRTIGDQMAESAFTAPHASHHDTARAGGLVDARERLKQQAEAAGVHLTYMPFVMKAVAAVLPEYPAMNAELDEEAGEIRYHDRYHIGVAVATDAGLMVPVVENVDRKGLLEVAAEVNDLVERARSRDLAPEELQGSTFTITNFGAIGGEYATPILNHPETGILGLGELTQRPVVESGEVVAAHTLPLSVSIDHRVVDGAVSAGFCNDLKTYLDDPIHLLL